MGPGTYKGNDLDFGKGGRPCVRISPRKKGEKKYYDPPTDITPDPGVYDVKKGTDFVRPKVTDVKIQ